MPLSSEENHCPYYIPLFSFEKHLLSSLDGLVAEYYPGRNKVSHDSIMKLMGKWEWFGLLQELAVMDDMFLDSQGVERSKRIAKHYEGVLHSHVHKDFDLRSLARIEMIKRVNQDIVERLANIPVKDVSLCFLDGELPYWQIITTIYDAIPNSFMQKIDVGVIRGRFKILQLIQIFTLMYHPTQHPTTAGLEDSAGLGFKQVYETSTVPHGVCWDIEVASEWNLDEGSAMKGTNAWMAEIASLTTHTRSKRSEVQAYLKMDDPIWDDRGYLTKAHMVSK